MTDKQLADVLKISRRTLQDYRTNGILSYYLLGGKCYIKKATCKNYLTIIIIPLTSNLY